MKPTRDIHKANTTATNALAKGNLDTARRAVVYSLKRCGLRDRVRGVPTDRVILEALLRACVLTARVFDLENQAERNLFRKGA